MKAAKQQQPKQKAGKPSLGSFILRYNQCFVLTRGIILPEQAERLHTLQSRPADRKPFTGNLLAFGAKCLTSVSNLFPITGIPGRSLAGGRKRARRAACGALPPGDLVNNTMEQTAGLSPPLALLRVPHSTFHHLPLHFSPFSSLLPGSSSLPGSSLPLLSSFSFSAAVCPRHIRVSLSPDLPNPSLVPRCTPRCAGALGFLLGLGLRLQHVFCDQFPPPSALSLDRSLPLPFPLAFSPSHNIFHMKKPS